MSVKIITDSTFDTVNEVKERLITVPLTVNFGEEEYIDGVTITHKQFYEKLIETDVIPTTSQATPAAFSDEFDKVGEDGAVVITLSGKLSGTYQSAMIAAADYDNVFVVDSGSVTIGAGILAERALNLSEEGKNAKEIADILEKEKKNICLIALVDTLEYLKRGGRISKTVAFAGGLLNIKPVISVRGGEILMLGKARGSKQGNNLLITEIEKVGGVDFSKPIMLGFTGMSDLLLKKYTQDSSALWQGNTEKLRYTVVGSVIGTHVGPDAIAVAFFKK